MLKVISTFVDADYCGVTVSYKNRHYVGDAELHPQDQDYFSPIVGTNIALSRATIKAYQNEIMYLQSRINTEKEFYWSATKGQGIEDNGQFSNFTDLIAKHEKRLSNLRRALRSEKAALNNYLVNHKKAIKSFKEHKAEAN